MNIYHLWIELKWEGAHMKRHILFHIFLSNDGWYVFKQDHQLWRENLLYVWLTYTSTQIHNLLNVHFNLILTICVTWNNMFYSLTSKSLEWSWEKNVTISRNLQHLISQILVIYYIHEYFTSCYVMYLWILFLTTEFLQ